ncbi:MAG: ATP-binding protein [Saprospiraceae bacterium]
MTLREVNDLLQKKEKKIAQLERTLFIEAALERVRAAAMTMYKSEELVNVATVMNAQFKKLGITQAIHSGFVLIDEEKEVQYLWGSQTDTKLLEFFVLPLFGDQVLQSRFDAWKRQDPIFSTVLEKEALQNSLEVAMPNNRLTDREKESKSAMPDPTYFYFGNFRHGYLQIIAAEALNREQQEILARFAKVFEQVYTRFLDIQKAEAQTLQLQELDNAKTTLYTNITHEFRTPLTIILGMANQLKTQVLEEGEVGLQMIERNGHQLLQLVNQILDLQQLEAKSMPLNMVQGDFLPYLKYLVESFHSYAASKNIQIHFSTDLEQLQMDYDPEKIQNIIANLLSNALKFTPAEGNIYIQLQRKAHLLTLSIKDTGVGIEADELERIFDRFYQVENSTTRNIGGTGIGLALTKELVHLLQGEIEVKSQLTEGTEFIVRLPITLQAQRSEALPIVNTNQLPFTPQAHVEVEIHSPQSEKPKLLIVEDNADVVHYLQKCLQDDYQLTVAYDGELENKKAMKIIPDLIISDVMMPQKDGLELCDFLKNDIRTSHIPILLLTAKADLPARLQGIKQGANAYLAKPFVTDELLTHLNALLQQRHRLQAHYRHLFGIVSNAATAEITLESEKESEFVQTVKTEIQAHLDDANFSVTQLSHSVAISNAQLYRKLKAQTGYSPQELIRSIRLEHAKQLLKNANLSIAEIAYTSGFSEPDYFSKVFKKAFGMRPSDYRALSNTNK